ncbi:MAG TPA: STAS domain-containing protein [Bryobacteraceae bacterium]|nr:STAS domain-containing protein [Bryobacteraceae bacterium]
MALQIQQRDREGIAILDLDGRIIVGEHAAALRDKLRELIAASQTRILLNLAAVDFIDSTGLGALVVGHTGLKKLGGRLALENLNDRNIELLVLTKLSTIFDVFDDEQQAINSFFPDREIQKFDILNFVREQSGE